jgi:3-phenylpropionate/cinnamic acid dioxygenase small subunit
MQQLINEDDIWKLFFRMGRALDEKDWHAYGASFDDECEFVILGRSRVGRDEIVAGPVRDLTRFPRTQHLHTNQVIGVDGDEASARVYCIAVHGLDEADRTKHYTIGIRYDALCRRTAAGWHFAGACAVSVGEVSARARDGCPPLLVIRPVWPLAGRALEPGRV